MNQFFDGSVNDIIYIVNIVIHQFSLPFDF